MKNTETHKTIQITWSTIDIIGTAKEQAIELTIPEAYEILQTIERRHDAEIGINWDVITSHIEIFEEARKQKQS